MLRGDSIEFTRYIYLGLMSQFKPFKFESGIVVDRAFDIDFYREEFLVTFELFPEHFYRLNIGVEDMIDMEFIFFAWTVGEQAGKYFRSIAVPVEDNIVLGDN